ncbi:class I SAM-dependent methyltransferase [Lysobacter enzymogenes]|uniref:class I SAM-dependent methyltransferase n=1 Tax=Lysobacter enzymogenes TaxID=69 RepID=UPI0008964376|nr:class I SAM-dependent methyltransferase [Lysobacter enzymogenes]SDW50527.1 Methyltransferase domain-containing protein [Lysobacter enzymogenes]
MSADETARHSDARVLEAWRENAAPWTQTVRAQAIESRRLVTDRAILDAALRLRPRDALDLGCGEGWLTRALRAGGVAADGIDAIGELIDAARRADPDAPPQRYARLSYEDIAAGASNARYDLIVCNFSLLGGAAVDALLSALPALLRDGGHVLIQTLHPPTACGDAPYLDGWRDGSWAGCDGAFGQPAPWYFRTLGGWLRVLRESGLVLRELEEPVHPVTGKPVSLILDAVGA